jgi:hypothetical protein
MTKSKPYALGLGVLGGLTLAVCGFIVLHLLFDRTREFRTKAEAGQPIVRAIEEFKVRTGNYPTSLSALVPSYLPVMPDTPDIPNHKFGGWEYQTETNGGQVSYSLRCDMGRGGVEYEPPNWIGNDEGHKVVILRNK